MDFIEIIKAIILGIVQGITEWLPISSTGHLILVEDFMSFRLSPVFINTFFVVIQFGSILAVVVLYFAKLNPFHRDKRPKERRETLVLWFKIALASIPAAIIGFLFEDVIDRALYNPTTVAIALIVYGILFIIIENRRKPSRINHLGDVSYMTALGIGLFQVLALAGTSRSGSTFWGQSLWVLPNHCRRILLLLAIPVMVGRIKLQGGFAFRV